MTISITPQMGTGVVPRILPIFTTSTYSQVTTLNWLAGAKGEGFPIQPTDIIAVAFNGGQQFFYPTINSSGIQLAPLANFGNVIAGSNGIAGYFQSFPSTANKGSLILEAINNVGNTVTRIRNAAMGQASIISIPDPGGATANFVLAPAALVSGNLVKASGTAGLVVDAGARIIANTTGTYAGGGTSNAFTATGLTSAAVGSAVIRTSTNAVSIAKAVPSTDMLTITFSADPGADTTVDYIYVTAAQA